MFLKPNQWNHSYIHYIDGLALEQGSGKSKYQHTGVTSYHSFVLTHRYTWYIKTSDSHIFNRQWDTKQYIHCQAFYYSQGQRSHREPYWHPAVTHSQPGYLRLKLTILAACSRWPHGKVTWQKGQRLVWNFSITYASVVTIAELTLRAISFSKSY